MGKCCSAKYICGLTEFIEDVIGGGGGVVRQVLQSIVSSTTVLGVAGNANLTYDGTSLKVTGQIQSTAPAICTRCSGQVLPRPRSCRHVLQTILT